MEQVIVSNIRSFGSKVKEMWKKSIVGKGDVVELVIVALFMRRACPDRGYTGRR